jgi:hypothetical protein
MTNNQTLSQSAGSIDQAIIDAAFHGRISSGLRQGALVLASLFHVTRISVQKALIGDPLMNLRNALQMTSRTVGTNLHLGT